MFPGKFKKTFLTEIKTAQDALVTSVRVIAQPQLNCTAAGCTQTWRKFRLIVCSMLRTAAKLYFVSAYIDIETTKTEQGWRNRDAPRGVDYSKIDGNETIKNRIPIDFCIVVGSNNKSEAYHYYRVQAMSPSISAVGSYFQHLLEIIFPKQSSPSEVVIVSENTS